jgi:large conductance mechanosensitive channel
MFKEFKAFALKGNAMDLAVAVVLGAAFGKIVSSFVGDVIMPMVGMLLGKVDFTNLFVALDGSSYTSLAAAKAAGAATINYGVFINTLIDFVLIAFCLYLIIKPINKMRGISLIVEAPKVKECPFCLSTIPEKATKCPNCTSQL